MLTLSLEISVISYTQTDKQPDNKKIPPRSWPLQSGTRTWKPCPKTNKHILAWFPEKKKR